MAVTDAAGRTAAPSAAIVGATMRLSVVTDAGPRTDLVVPVWVEVGDVAAAYAERVGVDVTPTLRRATGQVLDPELALERAGLRHGTLLLASWPHGGEPAVPLDDPDRADRADRAYRADPATPSAPAPGWRRPVAVAAAVCVVLAGLAGVGAGSSTGLPATVTAALLALAGLLALVPLGSGGLGAERVRLARLHVAPFCLAGAALVGVGPSAAHPLLPFAVAALAALAASAAAWALSDDDAVGLVWLWGSGVVAAACVVLLLLGAGTIGLWALLVAGGVVAVRLLPSLVVDVPDETLLDLDNLAVTAWSAHDESRPKSRRRPVVRRPEVLGLARRSGTVLRSSTGAAAAVLVLGTLLLLPAVVDATAWVRVGSQVMVGSGAAAVALVARGYRDWRLQVLLRASAAVLVAALAVSLVRATGPTGGLVLVLLGVVAGGVVVGAGVALGHGWRSVWWARVADVLQGLGFALTLSALPLASGLFDFVWRFTS